ncbi:MAG TPA: type II toxin-antitoxin system RelE/ParE family toxin [Candidatus Angelobacter sp.]|nr:type II toxin-antitoxin system RelE/ParE family toxin [Candidatus Angelobacter sp.]
MAHRLAPQAEADLDGIWYHVAKESSSLETANRLIDTITNRFVALASFPYLGRSREDDFGPGYRSLAVGEYVIVYWVETNFGLFMQVFP